MSDRSRKTILCYGDSNTHGTRARPDPLERCRYRSSVRWPGRLARNLGPRARVIEEGLPGRTSVHDDPIDGAHLNGKAILPAILESHAPVDIVVLMLGTNDLKTRFSLTAVDIARAIDRLLDVIAASATGPHRTAPSVLLLAPAPIEEIGLPGGHFAGGAAISRHLGVHYELLAERRGCGFLDAGRVAAVDTVDGIHLTELGHAALADAVAAVLEPMLHKRAAVFG